MTQTVDIKVMPIVLILFVCIANQHTDAQMSLHTLLVKYYNDLLGRQSSEQDRDEVTYFYVCWGPFLYTPWHANFQEKIFVEISRRNA